jgi:hypothetical protein
MIWVFLLLVAAAVALMLVLTDDRQREPADQPLRVEWRRPWWFVVDDIANVEHGPFSNHSHANNKLRELRKQHASKTKSGDGGQTP